MSSYGIQDVPVESINQESLGLGQYIDSLSEFIEKCETPMTISIQGDWGCGKTSSMNMIREKISGKVIPIWFNTWQFSQFNMQSELSISLLSYFLGELDDGQGGVAKKAWGVIKGLTKTVAAVGAEQLVGGVVADKIIGMEGTEINASKALKTLKEELQKAVEQKLQASSKERIVVFIDDLDRLQPEKAVEMLEVMKLFLDVPRCVFVLAVDYGVVIRGVRKKYGDDIGDEKGKSFFDKIIQLPFNMPIGQYDLEKYFTGLLEKANVAYVESDLRIYKNLAEYSVGINPRGLKRIFNLMLLLNITAKNQNLLESVEKVEKSERQKVIFAVLCMQSAYEDAYKFLAKQKINETLLRNMADSDKLKSDASFEALRNVIKDEKKLENLAEFMERFIDSLQTNDDDSDKLSNTELRNLEGILKFSSITSVNENRGSSIGSSSERKQNRDAMKVFANELNAIYKDKFKSTKNSFVEAKFLNTQANDANESAAEVYLHLKTSGSFKLFFSFDSLSYIIYEWDSNSKANSKAGLEFTNLNFKDFEFNEIDEENGEMYSEDFNASMGFDEKLEKFKAKTRSVADRIFEVLGR